MPSRMRQLELHVEGQHASAWPRPEALFEDALAAANAALGRDVEQLAVDCGLSRRELNKQRERGDVDPDLGGPAALGHQWLYRAALWLDAVRRRYGADRVRDAARLVARACGVDLAEPVAGKTGSNSNSGIFRVSLEANRELGDYLDKLDLALANNDLDPVEIKGLIKELDDVGERTNGARNALLSRLEATATTYTFGHKAV